MEPLAGFAVWLETTGWRAWASGVYPVVNTLHLLGLVMLVGAIGVIDLRLAGLWRSIPAAPLARGLTPVAIGGLAIMLVSGLALFAADGRILAQSEVFRTKLLLIGLALANAVVFAWRWRSRLADWDDNPPWSGRAMALMSLGLWLAIGTYGRMIAYS